jgi:hypothetical protein
MFVPWFSGDGTHAENENHEKNWSFSGFSPSMPLALPKLKGGWLEQNI